MITTIATIITIINQRIIYCVVDRWHQIAILNKTILMRWIKAQISILPNQIKVCWQCQCIKICIHIRIHRIIMCNTMVIMCIIIGRWAMSFLFFFLFFILSYNWYISVRMAKFQIFLIFFSFSLFSIRIIREAKNFSFFLFELKM